MSQLPTQIHIAPIGWDGVPRAAGPLPGSGLDCVDPRTQSPLVCAQADILAGLPPEMVELLDGLHPHFKPFGGFWTSSLQANGRSAWEEFKSYRAGRQGRWMFEVAGSPRILTIQDDSDVLRLLGRDGGGKVRTADAKPFWALVAAEWDAVHVPEDHDHRGCLHYWDVESTVWLRPDKHLRLVSHAPIRNSRAKD